ncbi:protein translocase subunit SecD [bacterium endosymbiont of Pedicinus badii]|uniref:protein translocase subunit SecD n=1 Tax=bacterium endosymbiont of Pedicinus badii TaxID=1719126 RepID=UPI0009BC371D|nr:protein translocase subunit SecD [bacterium endosymbiont of Pedicinus badii]OQM34282.1 hypothetical protein AOQ89_00060 [bacterium endosymbiont of Pedicinus badii]
MKIQKNFFWKNSILLIVFFLSIIYSLPNFLKSHPYLQVSFTEISDPNKKFLFISDILKKNKIYFKSIKKYKNFFFIKFKNFELQNKAKKILSKYLIDAIEISSKNISTPIWMQKIGANSIKLGIDLVGGINLVVKVNKNEFLKEFNQKKRKSIENFLKNENLPYKEIIEKNDGIIEILFYEEFSKKKTVSFLQKNNIKILNFKKNSKSLEFKFLESMEQKISNLVEKNINIIKNRIKKIGISEYYVRKKGDECISIEIPKLQNIEKFKKTIFSNTRVEFRKIVYKNIEEKNKLFFSKDSDLYIESIPILDGNHILDSNVSINEYGDPQINVFLDNLGGRIIENFTRKNIGSLLSVVLIKFDKIGNKNYQVEDTISIAKIQSVISNNFRILGVKNVQEARKISYLFRSGQFELPIQIIEEKIVEPSLGKENIKKSILSCAIGILFSMLFITIHYKFFGVIAAFSLVFTLFLIISIFSIIPEITLNIYGLAGILLITAISVDINILINERIREESKKEKEDFIKIIKKSYKKVYSSIIDSSITTIIASIILIFLGNETIKSFSYATIIGTLISTINSFIFTKYIIKFLIYKKFLKKFYK